MELSPLAAFLQSRIDVLIRTCHSVIYVIRNEPDVVLKADTLWLDGKAYGDPVGLATPEQTSYDLSREYEIYRALGSHEGITQCTDLVRNKSGDAIILKLERSSGGNLRRFIEESSESPPMPRRLEMAVSFARSLAHVHSCGVIWGDLSTRNTLVFGNDHHLKLCDFASSALSGVYPEFGEHTYEARYRPALPEDEVDVMPMMQRELYALGSAIYEITEWKAPYSGVLDDNVGKLVQGGLVPALSETNPARDVIQRC